MQQKLSFEAIAAEAIANTLSNEIQQIQVELKLSRVPLNVEDYLRFRIEFPSGIIESYLESLVGKITEYLEREGLIENYTYRYHNYTDSTISMQGEIQDYVGHLQRTGYSNQGSCDLDWDSLLDKLDINKVDKITEYLKLVPSSGPAHTILGELLRACQRIIYRMWNDGDTSLLWSDASFTDNCNLHDFLSNELTDEMAKEIIQYYFKISEKLTRIEIKDIQYIEKVELNDFPFGEFPVESAIVLEETLFQIMCNHMTGDQELIDAIKAKDCDLVQQLLDQGKVVKIEHDYLMRQSDMDFRSELHYSQYR